MLAYVDGRQGRPRAAQSQLAEAARLVKGRRKHRSEHRIGADDQAAEAGGYGLQPGIAEAEIERVVAQEALRVDGARQLAVVAALQRRLGSNRIAAEMAEAQRDKR